eukprot:485791-Rhodomonas_salina.2
MPVSTEIIRTCIRVEIDPLEGARARAGHQLHVRQRGLELLWDRRPRRVERHRQRPRLFRPALARLFQRRHGRVLLHLDKLHLVLGPHLAQTPQVGLDHGASDLVPASGLVFGQQNHRVAVGRQLHGAGNAWL